MNRFAGHTIRIPAFTLAIALALPFLTGCGGSGPSVEEDIAHPGAPENRNDPALEIERLLQKATHDPGEPYWHYAAGAAQARTGDTEAAKGSLRASLARDDSYEPAAALLADLCYERGEYEEAIAALEACGRSITASPSILTRLALHCDAAERYDRADDLRDRLSVPGPHWVENGSTLSYLHLRSTDFAGAARTAENALTANGESAANHNNYGIALLYRGDPARAQEAFTHAIALDPSLPGPYYNLAILEKYYFFDDEAAAAWFARYEEVGDGSDPDGIRPFMRNGDER